MLSVYLQLLLVINWSLKYLLLLVNLKLFLMYYKILFLFYRNSEKSQRSQLDLCVVVFRTRSPASPEVGRLVEHSKRQVRGFVGCHKMLERDLYILVCLAFNHWHTGHLNFHSYFPKKKIVNSICYYFLLFIRHWRSCDIPRVRPSYSQLKTIISWANRSSWPCTCRCHN